MGVALVIGSAVCFGTLGVFGKLAYRLGLTTPQLLSYRFALAAILLWLTAMLIQQPIPPRNHSSFSAHSTSLPLCNYGETQYIYEMVSIRLSQCPK